MNTRDIIECIVIPMRNSGDSGVRDTAGQIIRELRERGYLLPAQDSPLTDYGREMYNIAAPVISVPNGRYCYGEPDYDVYIIVSEPETEGRA
jgi:hypothetical protein